MTPLSDMRALVRRDLKDEDAAAYRWTNDDVDRAIARALKDYSLYVPRQMKTTLATTSGSRDINIATMTDRVRLYRVEFPVDRHPRRFQRFTTWQNILTLVGDDQGDGNNCYVYWGKLHVIDGTENSVDSRRHDLVALGAAAYAALAWSVFAVNQISSGGPNVDRDYGLWGRDALARFYAELRRAARGLATSRLVSAEAFYESGA